MPRILFPEWRDENAPRKYPFSDSATLTSISGLAFDVESFLDASLYPIGGGERLYLSRIDVRNREVTLVLADPGQSNLASTSFDPLDPPDTLAFLDLYGRPAGILVTEAANLSAFQTWPAGSYPFSVEATEFCASCVVPMPQPGVRGVLLEDGTLLTGDVWIVGENGVVVRKTANGDIRVDIVGDPLFRRRLCQPVSLFSTPRFIRTINGMKPDARGDFKITVGSYLASDTVLRLFADDDGGLKFEVVGQPLTPR